MTFGVIATPRLYNTPWSTATTLVDVATLVGWEVYLKLLDFSVLLQLRDEDLCLKEQCPLLHRVLTYDLCKLHSLVHSKFSCCCPLDIVLCIKFAQ